jgi:putative transposase
MKDKLSIPQIISIIKEQESGIGVPELCRKHSIGQSTFYRWKGLYGGMSVSEAQRLKHLEAENSKLKSLVADLSLDKVMLQEVLSKKA